MNGINCSDGSPNSMGTTSDDMLSNESESLPERVAELEKKVVEQEDEIVCLRSTLADVVRRLAILETSKVPLTTNNVANYRQINGTSNLPCPPSRRRPLSSFNMQQPQPQTQQAQGIAVSAVAAGNGTAVRTNSSGVSSRRSSHQYQSTSSLHSDGRSSSSVSPVPSPSPYPVHPTSGAVTLPQIQPPSARSSPSPRHTPAPTRSNTQPSMKKWSSSVDFSSPSNSSSSSVAQGLLQRRMVSGVTAGSMFNLHATKPSSTLMDAYRHGTKDAVFNADDNCLKMYLRGRPIILYGTDELTEEYELAKVDPLPNERLKLDWVYGYRGRDCRTNVHYLPTGEMVYFVAAVVVLYNVEESTQRHYLGHTDDVKCIAVHPNKLVVATGQVAGRDRREGKPHVRIWDSVSLNTLHVIGVGGDFCRSIACLAFSRLDGGSLLCIVDDGHDHGMSIWDWHKGDCGQKLMETKSSSDPVLSVEFHPMDRYVIVTCGKGHVNFWSLESGSLAKSSGVFDKNKPKFVHCLAFTEGGDLVTGDSNGSLLVWGRGSNRVQKAIVGAHDGGIFSVFALKDGTFVSGGGKDRCIREWNTQVQPTGNAVEISGSVGAIRTLSQGKGNFILVGTTKNCILQGTLTLGFQTAVQGHTDELCGLAIHPSQNQFVTCGQDSSAHLWDTMAHSVVWRLELDDPAQSACYSPDGSTLVVATAVGRWMVFDAETRELVSRFVDGKASIDVVKFSPDGRHLALGSHDNNIYVYQVQEGYRKFNRLGRCVGHSSFVTHFDWSEDSTYIRSNSADLELLFWNATVCRQIPHPTQMRNLAWQTETCPIGFSVLGIWPDAADGTDVNCCARSNGEGLLATGDDWGKVKLFAYPSCHPKALCHIYGGHSSHVTNVAFLPDDGRLLTIGGKDCSIMQWMLC